MRVALLGFGSVGRGIARAILTKGLDITVTGLADSRSGSLTPAGSISRRRLPEKSRASPAATRASAPWMSWRRQSMTSLSR